MTTYDFTDAQQKHREYPDTFEAPTKRQLNAIAVGDDVKVCHNNERFWVLVTAVEGDSITGTVDNDLVCEQPFSYGDTITFEKRHVYQTLRKEERK